MSGGERSPREKIADELAYNDECGPGPVSRQEYLDDADAILRIVREHEAGERGDAIPEAAIDRVRRAMPWVDRQTTRDVLRAAQPDRKT